MNRVSRRLVPFLVAIGFLAVGALVVYLLQRYGVTRTVVTQTGTTAQTITESNALALAVVTGLIALASAALTAILGHWYTASAERERRTAESVAARAARIRDQISAVATDIAAMLEGIRPMDEAGRGALDQYRAQLWGEARDAVRKAANAALPHIGVLQDTALRAVAGAVFDAHATWYASAEEALRSGGTEPDRTPADVSLEAFFARARVVIEEAERPDRLTDGAAHERS